MKLLACANSGILLGLRLAYGQILDRVSRSVKKMLDCIAR